jgi:hypothetical protein
MLKRSLFILSLIFITKFTVSCSLIDIIKEDCGTRTYYHSYEGISIHPAGIATSASEELDSLVKKDFKLGIIVDTNLQSGISVRSSWGFNTALARLCEQKTETIQVHKIETAKLFMVDPKTNTRKDAAPFFEVSYKDQVYTFDQLLEKFDHQLAWGVLTLSNYQAIPESVYFEIELHLDDDQVLSDKTPVINFIETEF